MSTEPSEPILDAVAEAPRLAAAVEAHLDEAPLPVDEVEVQSIAQRLQDRMQAGSSQTGPEQGLASEEATQSTSAVIWPALVGIGLALAAGVLLWSRTAAPPPPGPEAVQAPTLELKATAPPVAHVVEIPAPGVPVETGVVVRPGSRVLTSPERRETVVVLVQEGAATLAGTEIPAGHFGVRKRTRDGVVVTWFRDGERPPEQLEQGVFAETAVDEQLEELRWKALPTETLSTLDNLLEGR